MSQLDKLFTHFDIASGAGQWLNLPDGFVGAGTCCSRDTIPYDGKHLR